MNYLFQFYSNLNIYANNKDYVSIKVNSCSFHFTIAIICSTRTIFRERIFSKRFR